MRYYLKDVKSSGWDADFGKVIDPLMRSGMDSMRGVSSGDNWTNNITGLRGSGWLRKFEKERPSERRGFDKTSASYKYTRSGKDITLENTAKQLKWFVEGTTSHPIEVDGPHFMKFWVGHPLRWQQRKGKAGWKLTKLVNHPGQKPRPEAIDYLAGAFWEKITGIRAKKAFDFSGDFPTYTPVSGTENSAFNRSMTRFINSRIPKARRAIVSEYRKST